MSLSFLPIGFHAAHESRRLVNSPTPQTAVYYSHSVSRDRNTVPINVLQGVCFDDCTRGPVTLVIMHCMLITLEPPRWTECEHNESAGTHCVDNTTFIICTSTCIRDTAESSCPGCELSGRGGCWGLCV